MPTKTKKPVALEEVDRTDHDMNQHARPMPEKSKAWYEWWGNVCPVCKAPANVVMEEAK